MQISMNEFMELERRKAMLLAIAQMEIALNTFYGSDKRFNELNELKNRVEDFTKGYLM